MSRMRGAALVFGMTMVAQSVTRNAAFARLVGGLVLLYLFADLAKTTSTHIFALRMGAAVPGAVLVASGTGVALHQQWAPPLTAAVICLVTATALFVADTLPPGRTWLLLILTIGGVYACVPETGQIGPLAVGAAGLGLFEVVQRTPLPRGALAAAIGITAWAVTYGGTYRDSALIGGFASLGLLLTFPVAVHLAAQRSTGWHVDLADQVVLVAVHGGAALLVSRTAGLASSLPVAVVIAAAVLAVQVGLAVVVVVAVRSGRAGSVLPSSIRKVPNRRYD